jgi:hypothetical protein
MDLIALIIGLFILAAIVRNKELSGDDATEQNKEIYTYFAVFVVILVLAGLGFLWKIRLETIPNMSLILPVYILMIPFTAFVKGPTKIIIKVATLSLLVYVIMWAYTI